MLLVADGNAWQPLRGAGIEQCAGKRIFFTMRGAWDAITKQTKRRGKPIKPYRCRICQNYHIGGDWNDR